MDAYASLGSMFSLLYSVSDSSGNMATAERSIYLVDNVAPELVLLGENPFFLEYGEVFRDPGFIARDNFDANVQTSWETNWSGTKPQRLPFSFSVLYVSVDQQGNSNSKSRIVHIHDTRPPSITPSFEYLQVEISSILNGFPPASCSAIDIYDGDVSSNCIWTAPLLPNTPMSMPLNVSGQLSVVDTSQNFAHFDVVFELFDATPPSIIFEERLTVECGIHDLGVTVFDAADGTIAEFVSHVVAIDSTSQTTQACSPPPFIYRELLYKPFESRNCGNVNVTVEHVAQDSSGNVAKVTQEVRVVDSKPPTLSFRDDFDYIQFRRDGEYELGVLALDECDGYLSEAICASVRLFRLNTTWDGDLHDWALTNRTMEQSFHTLAAVRSDAQVGSVYQVDLIVFDRNGHNATAFRRLMVVDTEPPRFKSQQLPNLSIPFGTIFRDPGVEVDDNHDTIVEVTTVHSIDVFAPGSYAVQYIALDCFNNKAEALRNVQVLPLQFPAPAFIVEVVVSANSFILLEQLQDVFRQTLFEYAFVQGSYPVYLLAVRDSETLAWKDGKIVQNRLGSADLLSQILNTSIESFGPMGSSFASSQSQQTNVLLVIGLVAGSVAILLSAIIIRKKYLRRSTATSFRRSTDRDCVTMTHNNPLYREQGLPPAYSQIDGSSELVYACVDEDVAGTIPWYSLPSLASKTTKNEKACSRATASKNAYKDLVITSPHYGKPTIQTESCDGFADYEEPSNDIQVYDSMQECELRSSEFCDDSPSGKTDNIYATVEQNAFPAVVVEPMFSFARERTTTAWEKPVTSLPALFLKDEQIFSSLFLRRNAESLLSVSHGRCPFLVRQKSPDTYVISLKYRESYRHHKLQQQPTGPWQINGKPLPLNLRQIDDVIKFLRNNHHEQLSCKLGEWVVPADGDAET